MIKVFAIIVTYNGLTWIDKCISSLYASTLPLEILVIDNASTDLTVENIEKKFPKVCIIRQDLNHGFGQANNIGLRKAYDMGADYVFLLNQDAWIESNTIENLVKIAEENKTFGILSPIHLNGSGSALDYNFSKYISPEKCKNLYSDIYTGNIKKTPYEALFVNAAAWLISRNCLATVGGFNPLFFHYGEDDNYVHRLNFHGFKLGVVATTRIFHDRENQEISTYFADNEKILTRYLLIKYCNPLENEPISAVNTQIIKEVTKALFTCDIRLLQTAYQKCKIITALKRKITEVRKMTMKPFPTFL